MQISITIPPALMENPDRLTARAESIFISELLSLWRQYLLPAFRKTTPFRSGQLRRSLHIVRDGNRLIIGVKPQGFYWFMVSGLPQRYQILFERLMPQMVDIALLRTKNKLGL